MEKVPLHPKKAAYLKIEDVKFAEDLAQELKLPLDDLKELIADTRKEIHDISTFIKNDCDDDDIPSDVVAPWHRPMVYDYRIQKISVETNKGIIEFFPTDPYYRLLIAPLRKIKKSVKQALSRYKKESNQFSRICMLADLLEYFSMQDSLNKTTALYATGLCMIHFEFYGYKPILKKEDFTDDYGAWDYKHYLVDIVKRRLRNTIARLYYDGPSFEEFRETDEYKEWLANEDNFFFSDPTFPK